MSGKHARRSRVEDLLVIVFFDVASIAVGSIAGWLLDRVAESAPLLLLFGSLVGLVVAGTITWSRLTESTDA